MKVNIGIACEDSSHPQIKILDGNYQIDDELNLFTVTQTDRCYSPANNVLYDKDGKENFMHEQNLIIRENEVALIMGCGHSGIVNIMNEANIYQPKICIGGYHLFNPITKKTVSTDLLDSIANELQKYLETMFYTCHCTGREAFNYLSSLLPNLHYLTCGEELSY